MAKRDDIDTSMYWSAHDILTRNAMFNFVLGGRGCGKTFDSKVRRIRHFIKTGNTFIYMRRYMTEFEDKQDFFKEVVDYFPQWEFKVDGMRGYMRHSTPDDEPDEKWRVVVYFVTLSTHITKKSVSYQDVDWIVFDEFIIDVRYLSYLPNEVKDFQDFYNTVDRWNDRVRVMFLANAVSIVNPYFLAYNISPRRGQRFTKAKSGYICVEMVQSEKFKRYVDSTKFGQMIKETTYYDYAVGNHFFDDTDTFIKKKPECAKFVFAVIFDGETYAVWCDYLQGEYYVNRKVPKGKKAFVLTRDDMQPNMVMIEKISPFMKLLKALYLQGSIWYSSIVVRENFTNVLDYLGVR